MLGSSSEVTSFLHSHGLISQQAHVPWGQMSTEVTDKIRESGLLVGTQKVPEGWELLGKWTSKPGGVKGRSAPFHSIAVHHIHPSSPCQPFDPQKPAVELGLPRRRRSC